MTAEIAVLNKSAVALASDSAVTISAGSKEEKIYFSADKLFELSRRNPIGVMVYNGMHFMQTPLHILIGEYREQCRSFERVEDAAADFLAFLNRWGKTAPAVVSDQAISNLLQPLIGRMQEHLVELLRKVLTKQGGHKPNDIDGAYEEAITHFEEMYGGRADANFIGAKPRITASREAQIRDIARSFGALTEGQLNRVVNICKRAIVSAPLSSSRTGVVVAGFGSRDLFPTLVSYEIDGIIFGSLKYVQTNHVDIDRRKERARVLPFAQKEMVERFLYGIDGEIEQSVFAFCANTVPAIRDQILGHLQMSDRARETLTEKSKKAEGAFLTDLTQKAFEQIRTQSRTAIEGMVEFMPKPELATMAEALVNLTSIKRRVSRGMETVGGPIDVAVISKTEGFVWVKRKHYFPSELNPRYAARVLTQIPLAEGQRNGAVKAKPVSR